MIAFCKKMVLSLIICIYSCNDSNINSSTPKEIPNNKEIAQIYKKDQSDREGGKIINRNAVSTRDRLREKRVYELLDSNLLHTSLDYSNAAMIFQHGIDTISSGMAIKMMQKAIELNPKANKWLLAAAIDRDLMRRGKSQIYGTQYIKSNKNGSWEIYNLDTTKISDEERRKYNVETLKEQQEKVIKMNNEDLLNTLLGL